MLGFQYLKTNPTQYVIQYRRGRVKRAGAGLAFYYFRAISSISLVPISSVDVPFIFNEITKDFQPITVQGQLVYRITDPKLVASLLNYTVAGPNNNYISEDPERLAQRLVNLAQAHTRAEVQAQEMRAAIHNSETISRAVMDNLSASETLSAMGVEIISFAILAIKPIPEIGRALEAEAREMLLKQADDAIYERRNSAVEQERRIKENELNTEIAVEEKNRKIQETKIAGKIEIENERKKLMTARSENIRAEAEAQSFAVEASLKPLKSLDKEVLQLLSMQSAEPRLMAAAALKDIAKNASKIGQLNITPELLATLLNQPPNGK